MASDLVDHAALYVNEPDDVENQWRVKFAVDLALQIADVAADAGEILPEVNQQTVSRVFVVVERVVGQRIAQRRSDRRAIGKFLANGQGRLTVGVAPQGI